MRIGNEMTWQIRNLDDENFEQSADTLAEAFRRDPFFVYLVKDEEQRRRWTRVVMAANIRFLRPGRAIYVAVDENARVGGVIGNLPPGAYPTPLLRDIRFMIEMALKPSLFEPPLREILRGVKYQMAWDRMHIKQPHWYVNLLGVRPELQGQGLGRMLMSKVIENAKRDQVPVYLETQTEDNLRFYKACGLKVKEEVHPAVDGPHSWSLIRA